MDLKPRASVVIHQSFVLSNLLAWEKGTTQTLMGSGYFSDPAKLLHLNAFLIIIYLHVAILALEDPLSVLLSRVSCLL